MADVQCENGYTKIANQLLEAIVRARFAGNEVSILLFLIRESYGWKNRGSETLKMGTRKMEEKTGIPRSSIQLALNVLLEANVIERGAVGWVINKDYETWLTGQPAGRGGPAHRTTTGQPTGLQQASPLATYKDKERERNRKKTTVAAPRQKTPVQEIVELYKFLKMIGFTLDGTVFRRDEGVHAAWDKANFAVYVRSAKKLLAAFEGDLERAKVYMTTKAQEWDQAGLEGWELHGIARDAVNFIAKEKTNAKTDGGRAPSLYRHAVGEPAPSVDVPRRSGQYGTPAKPTQAGDLAREAVEKFRPHE